jgi:hypothetical protein
MKNSVYLGYGYHYLLIKLPRFMVLQDCIGVLSKQFPGSARVGKFVWPIQRQFADLVTLRKLYEQNHPKGVGDKQETCGGAKLILSKMGLMFLKWGKGLFNDWTKV